MFFYRRFVKICISRQPTSDAFSKKMEPIASLLFYQTGCFFVGLNQAHITTKYARNIDYLFMFFIMAVSSILRYPAHRNT